MVTRRGEDKPIRSGGVLFVFDESLRIGSGLERVLAPERLDSVALYPLTSDFTLISEVEAWLTGHGAGPVRRLDAVADVDAQVRQVREGIADWAHRVGNETVEHRSAKEWFYIDRYRVSTWWLGLLAEKNTLKTRAFLHVAQIRALDTVLRAQRFAVMVIALAEPTVEDALRMLARREGMRISALSAGPIGSFGRRVTIRIENAGWVGAAAIGAASWLRLVAKWAAARLSMGSMLPRCAGTLLFATYFPAFDEASAARGHFVNRYTGPLQALLDRLGLPVTWLLVYVPLHGASFWSALKQARRFRARGALLFFPEQLLTPVSLAQIVFAWLRQIVVARRICHAWNADACALSPLLPECRPIVERLWRISFAGPTGLHGLAYLAMFRRLWRQVPRPRAVAYICEMHAWEKALLGTRRGLADGIPAIGVQHTVVARDYFHYFTAPADVRDDDARLGLPHADFLAANGPEPAALLSRCCYPGMREVEALRYTNLGSHPGGTIVAPSVADVPTLLVVGSLDEAETRAMAQLVSAAFEAGNEVCIAMKSHPYTPFRKILDAANIDWRGKGFRLVDGAIIDCLQGATGVLVASSAVAVEAVELGKVVIVPRFADNMVMSPLDGRTYGCVWTVRTPDELRQCWQAILRQTGSKTVSDREPTQAATRYWHLDPELPRWSRLLKEAAALN